MFLSFLSSFSFVKISVTNIELPNHNKHNHQNNQFKTYKNQQPIMEHLKPTHISCTKPIKTNEYFQKFAQGVKELYDAASMKQISKQIQKKCSIKELSHDGEPIQTMDKAKLFTPMHLNSLQSSGHLSISRMKIKWDCMLDKERTTLSYPQEPSNEDALDIHNLTPYKDSLMVVRYYRPFSSSTASIYGRCQAQYIAEFAILTSQYLTDLRDKFKCVHDYHVSAELEHPDEKSICYTKDDYPSCFLFIENCFYNDMRHKDAIEYSKEIIEWASKRGLNEFTTGRMETTKIGDMNIRIGYPYVFQHQGNCEHLVVFTDTRLLRPDEVLDLDKYPYTLSTNRFRMTGCSMCQNSYADFLITECERLPKKHNYMCKKCVLAYNYQDGKKVGRFKLYPYFDLNLLAFF